MFRVCWSSRLHVLVRYRLAELSHPPGALAEESERIAVFAVAVLFTADTVTAMPALLGLQENVVDIAGRSEAVIELVELVTVITWAEVSGDLAAAIERGPVGDRDFDDAPVAASVARKY
jgi:hypothetical protein